MFEDQRQSEVIWSVHPSIQQTAGEKTLAGLAQTWKLQAEVSQWRVEPSTFLRQGDSAARCSAAPLYRSMIMQMESNLDNIIEN